MWKEWHARNILIYLPCFLREDRMMTTRMLPTFHRVREKMMIFWTSINEEISQSHWLGKIVRSSLREFGLWKRRIKNGWKLWYLWISEIKTFCVSEFVLTYDTLLIAFLIFYSSHNKSLFRFEKLALLKVAFAFLLLFYCKLALQPLSSTQKSKKGIPSLYDLYVSVEYCRCLGNIFRYFAAIPK